MADIRIKDLATLESASLTGDVFVIDGTTGTRKLSAFSPTFGGNATVTGTLTVNGGSADLGTGHGVKLYVNNAGAWANKELLVTGYDVLDYTQIKVPGNASNTASIKLNQNGLATFSGNILVSGTTASTTTSTGALVVGNGTSGGLGVGGAANIGGTLTVSNPVVAQGTTVTGYQFLAKDTGGTAVGAAYALQTSGGTDKWRWGLRGSAGSLTDSLIFSALDGSWVDALTLGKTGNATIAGTLTVNGAATSINVTNSGGLLNFSGTGNTTTIKEVRMVNSGGGDWMSLGITGSAYAGVLTGLGNDEPFIYAPATFRIFRGTGLTNRFDFAADQLKINATTASTSTSSGALVVSGGVGVSGAINAGGAITTASGQGFDTPNWRFYQSGSSGYVRDLVNGQMALQFVSGNASTIQVYATGTQDSTSTTSGALVSSGGLGVAGAVNAGTFYGLVDGVTAPATAGGYARIYVDSADGDLKVKFGDGTVKTIATDS